MRPLVHLLVGGIVFVLLCAAPSAYGQQADTTQLPEIAPREIEIRGERQIDLPSLERQPLTGFASPPQIPTVPADHRPYVDSYKQTLDDLPESLPVPETVSASMQPAAAPTRGFLQAGSGRYFSRFFEGRVRTSLSDTEQLLVHGSYNGTEANPNDDVAAAEVRLKSNRKLVEFDLEGHGSVQRYDLFGVSATASRKSYAAGGAAHLETQGSVPVRATVRYDHVQYTSYLGPNSDGRVYSQGQLDLRGEGTIPVPFRPHLDVRYRRSWFGGDVPTNTGDNLDAGASLRLYQTERATVAGGLRILTYETPVRPGTPALRGRAFYLSPSLDVKWRFGPNAVLHVRNRPRLGDTALDRLYATNPYAASAPSLQPPLETINTEAGVTLSYGAVRLVPSVGYRYAPVFRYFSLAGTGLYRVQYNSARVLHGGAHLALQGMERLQASVGVSVRDGVLTPQGRTIPNFASVTADATLTFSFAGGDGFIKALTHFKSPRKPRRTDPNNSDKNNRVGSYFTLDLEGSYALTSTLEIVARAEHLSAEKPTLWKRYPRPRAKISLGLRLQW